MQSIILNHMETELGDRKKGREDSFLVIQRFDLHHNTKTSL